MSKKIKSSCWFHDWEVVKSINVTCESFALIFYTGKVNAVLSLLKCTKCDEQKFICESNNARESYSLEEFKQINNKLYNDLTKR